MQYRMMFHVYPMLVAAAVAGLVAVDRQHALIGLLASGALALASLAPSVLDTPLPHGEPGGDAPLLCACRGSPTAGDSRQVLPAGHRDRDHDGGGHRLLLGSLHHRSARPHRPRGRAPWRAGEPIRRGHTQRASSEYLSSRGVNLVIHHPRVFSCLQPRTKGPGAHRVRPHRGGRLPAHAATSPRRPSSAGSSAPGRRTSSSGASTARQCCAARRSTSAEACSRRGLATGSLDRYQDTPRFRRGRSVPWIGARSEEFAIGLGARPGCQRRGET